MSDALPLKYVDHAHAVTLPHPFARDLLRLEQLRDMEPFQGNLSPLQPLLGSDGWWSYGHARLIGSIRLSSLVALGRGEGRSLNHDGLMVILNFGGEINLAQKGQAWACRTGECLVLPAFETCWSGGPVSLMLFRLQPERILRAALPSRASQRCRCPGIGISAKGGAGAVCPMALG